MSLLRRITQRADVPGEDDEARPVRLMPKDKGLASRFDARTPPPAPLAARRQAAAITATSAQRHRSVPDLTASRQSAQETDEDMAPARRETDQQEDSDQAGRTAAADTAQAHRQEDREEDALQTRRAPQAAAHPATGMQARRSSPRGKQDEDAELRTLRRSTPTEDEDEEEVQAQRMPPPPPDAQDPLDAPPAPETRADPEPPTAQATAVAPPAPPAAALPPAGGADFAAPADAVPGAAQSGHPGPHDQTPTHMPILPPRPAHAPSSEPAPQVVIDQIDVLIAAEPSARQGQTAGAGSHTGARAVLARRFLRGI